MGTLRVVTPDVAALRARVAQAAMQRLPAMPPSCRKCHSLVLEIYRDGCIHCSVCGWTGFLRSEMPVPVGLQPAAAAPPETPAEYHRRGGLTRSIGPGETTRRAHISTALLGAARRCSRCHQAGHYSKTCRVKAPKQKKIV